MKMPKKSAGAATAMARDLKEVRHEIPAIANGKSAALLRINSEVRTKAFHYANVQGHGAAKEHKLILFAT